MADDENAETAYRHALKSNPKNPPILNGLAATYAVENRNLKEAEALMPANTPFTGFVADNRRRAQALWAGDTQIEGDNGDAH